MADKRTRSDDIIGSPTEAGTVPELIRCCAQQRNGIAAGGLRAETFTVSPRFVRHGGQTMATHKYLQAARVVKRLPWWWEYGELRRAVVVGLEAAVGDLAGSPAAGRRMTAVRRPVLERDVEYGLDHVVPTVSRLPARVERRMIAQAPCARSAAIASPASLAGVCDARSTGIVKTCG